jgi:hypothetical protein
VESVEVEVTGDTIWISGTAFHPGLPEMTCTSALVYDFAEIEIPPLPVGQYRVIAGSLELPLEVTEEVAAQETEAVYHEPYLMPHSNRCFLGGRGHIRWWGFSELSIESPFDDARIYGRVIDDDPCGFHQEYGPDIPDLLIEVTRVIQEDIDPPMDPLAQVE